MSDTSTPASEPERVLLLRELVSRGHALSLFPHFRQDLKHLDEKLVEEAWRRIRQWYRHHVLKISPTLPLKPERKFVRVGQGQEKVWVIHLTSDMRIGLDWRDGNLILVRVGPHSGSRRIYWRAK